MSIVTFPFMFGLMFGDAGHGSLLLILGIVLVIMAPSEAKRKRNLLEYVRYVILLCGFFACYCGFVYNEFFSIPMSIFPSCYSLS